MSSMQDSVGMFVEFNIHFAVPEGLAVGSVVSKELTVNGDLWRLHCYPRGAKDDACAGEYLSVHVVNKSTARSGRVLFEATVLGRGAAAAGNPPSLYSTFQSMFDHPTNPVRMAMPRIFPTSDLAEHCAVCGYVTLVCGLVVLRHSPIPVPPSSLVHDLRGLEVQNRYGTPDVSVAVVDGKSVDVNSSVLSARSPVFKNILDGAANTAVKQEDSGMPPAEVTSADEETDCVKSSPRKITVDARALLGLQAWTLYALLVYFYCDRLPRDKECAGLPVTTELLRDLLAAADRFRLHRLKLMCAKKLWEDMSVETVSRTLWYAHEYNCRELKNACMKFITVADNSYPVMLTEEFHWLRQQAPAIIEELKQRGTTKEL